MFQLSYLVLREPYVNLNSTSLPFVSGRKSIFCKRKFLNNIMSQSCTSVNVITGRPFPGKTTGSLSLFTPNHGLQVTRYN